jgi:hypothetical protein
MLTVIAIALWLRNTSKWTAYDPGWLVEAAWRQFPDEPWLADALSVCTTAQIESLAYIRFVSPRRPNRPGSAWQFERNIVLEKTTGGTVVLDVLHGGRIGGVEFLSRLLDHGA